MKELNKLKNQISDWSDKTFNNGINSPKRSIAISHHLQKESIELTFALKEFIKNGGHQKDYVKVINEIADVQILIWDVCSKLDIDIIELKRIIEYKFDINKQRKWGTPDKNGVVEHVKKSTH